MDVDDFNMEVVYRIVDRTVRVMLDNSYVSIMIDDNKIDGYYVVNWDRLLHKFQEDTDVFRSGNVV